MEEIAALRDFQGDLDEILQNELKKRVQADAAILIKENERQRLEEETRDLKFFFELDDTTKKAIIFNLRYNSIEETLSLNMQLEMIREVMDSYCKKASDAELITSYIFALLPKNTVDL